MATSRRPTVRWNESAGRWMAWVRFPDGTRRKVERVDKAAAQKDLDELLALRASGEDAGPRRARLATFAEVLDAWIVAGCPTVSPSRKTRHAKEKSPNTIANATNLVKVHLRPAIGKQWVDRTGTPRLEEVFAEMAAADYATSTVDRTWGYLNQACQFGLRQRMIKTNPAADLLLPAAKPPKPRKSLTIEQAERLLTEAIPEDRQPALWITALMCGLRPGEITGLRWPSLDLDSEEPSIDISERALEVDKRYAGQVTPKTEKGRRRIGLHPLVVAALCRHRDEQRMIGLYSAEGFAFGTRDGTPQSVGNVRRSFKKLCERAGLEGDWTTYELRHSFVSLVSDQLDDLVKVADLAGHIDTRTTQGYRHPVRQSLPHAIEAWNRLLGAGS